MKIWNNQLAELVNRYETTKNPHFKTNIAYKLTQMFGVADSLLLKKSLDILKD